MPDQNYRSGTQAVIDIAPYFGGRDSRPGYKPKEQKEDFNFGNAMQYWLTKLKPYEATSKQLEWLWTMYGGELDAVGAPGAAKNLQSFKQWLATPEYKKGARYGVITAKPDQWAAFMQKVGAK